MNLKTTVPKGIIIRIEMQKTHLDFINKYNDPLWIMIDIHRVETMIKKGITSSYFNNNIRIITTTTIADDKLVNYFLEKELEIVKKFKPDFHVPCDFPVYNSQPKMDRLWFLKTYLSELKRFHSLSQEFMINIIPLIKGTDKNERKLCFKIFKELGLNYYAYYVSDSFGKSKGNPIKIISNEIRTLIAENCNCSLMIIGNQSIQGLEKLPPQIISSAGLTQWIKKANLGKVTPEESCIKIKNWKKRAEEMLSKGDDVLCENMGNGG